jgi:hypothetical protein
MAAQRIALVFRRIVSEFYIYAVRIGRGIGETLAVDGAVDNLRNVPEAIRPANEQVDHKDSERDATQRESDATKKTSKHILTARDNK